MRLKERALADHELAMFEAAVNNPVTDVIAHPFFMSPHFLRMPLDRLASLSLRMMEAVDEKGLVQALDRAHARRLAVELNANVVRYDQRHLERLYRLCLERGVQISFGTDAHELDEVAVEEELAEFIAGLGMTEADVWHPLAAN